MQSTWIKMEDFRGVMIDKTEIVFLKEAHFLHKFLVGNTLLPQSEFRNNKSNVPRQITSLDGEYSQAILQ